MKVFVIAMNSEAQAVINCLKNATEEVVYDKKIIRGDLYGEEIALIICGVGKVNAACATQYAIDVLNADVIVNLGVAGAVSDDCFVGDIYCIDGVVQYDFDLATLNGTRIGVLNEFTELYLPLKTARGYALRKLATGDRFNDSQDDFNLITKEMGADVRDMEGGAIAQVCAHANVPCYSFKCISDKAGSGATTEQFLNNLKLCNRNLELSLRHILGAING